MRNVNLVVLTSDTDCDGTSYGAYRYAVPERFALERDPEVILNFVRARDEVSFWTAPRNNADAFKVMPLDEFMTEFYCEFRDEYDRIQFSDFVPGNFGRDFTVTLQGRETGVDDPFPYTSLRSMARWNPWAGPDGDDTIGIPALDTRYEEPML